MPPLLYPQANLPARREEPTNRAPFYFLGATGGIAGAGFVRRGNKRLWNWYAEGLRRIEQASPRGILGTFQLSEIFSPLAVPTGPHSITAQQITRHKLLPYLSSITGLPEFELIRAGALETGVRFQPGKGSLGNLFIGSRRIATNVGMLRVGSRRGTTIADWFARIRGVDVPFTKGLFAGAARSRLSHLPIGVPTTTSILGRQLSPTTINLIQKARLTSNFTRAVGASLVGRLNILLRMPFEALNIVGLGKRYPWLSRFADLSVKPGTATRMLGRYAMRGLQIGAGIGALSYLDYLRRTTESRTLTTLGGIATGAAAGLLLSRRAGFGFARKAGLIGAAIGGIVGAAPAFDEGIYGGLATMWTRLMGAGARASQAIGATEARRRQEELAPGITKFTTALAFGLTGMMAGGFAGFAARARYGRLGYQRGLRRDIVGLARKLKREPTAVISRMREVRRAQMARLTEESISTGGKVRRALTKAYRWALPKTPGRGWTRVLQLLEERGGRIGAVVGMGTYGLLAAAAAFMTGHFVPGIVASKHTPGELHKIYSGEEEVPIRRGRWWPFGASAFGGGRIEYYRPHRIAAMRSRAKDIALYGSEEQKYEFSPWRHPIRFLRDPYAEERFLGERGYRFPISTPLGENIPIIGPLVSATLGRLIKPQVPMHEGALPAAPEPYGLAPAYGLGGLPARAPIGAEDPRAALSGMYYRAYELMGLPGFVASAVRESLTGRQELYEDIPQYETAASLTGWRRGFWEARLGDPGFCFVAGTPVLTVDGPRPIEEIEVGDRVVSLGGNSRRVTKVYRRKNDSRLLKVKVDCVDIEFAGTEGHRLPVFKRLPCTNGKSRPCRPGLKKHCAKCGRALRSELPEITELSLGDVSAGDYLCIPIYPEVGWEPKEWDLGLCCSYTKTDEYIYSKASKDRASLHEKIEKGAITTKQEALAANFGASAVSETFRAKGANGLSWRIRRRVLFDDLLFVIGWYLSEGHLDKWKIGFSLCKDKIDLAAASELESIFRKWGCTTARVPGNSPKSFQLNIHRCSPIVEFLEREFKSGAGKKRIPRSWKILSKRHTAILLGGLVNGDGFLNRAKRVAGFTSVSAQLVRDTFDLALKCGVIGHMLIDYTEISEGLYPQGTPRKDTVRSYVCWNRTQADNLASVLDGEEPIVSNHTHSFIHNDMLLVPVASVEEELNRHDEVYDLEIEDLHHYVVGQILVHNSETIRRFLPRVRPEIERYNPLPSGLPTWMPGENYFLNFQRASIYGKVPEPWLTLPGAGWAAAHPGYGVTPETAPEEYPAIARLKILSDVAVWSDELKRTQSQIRKMSKRGELSTHERALYTKINAQISAKKRKHQFEEYRFSEDALTQMKVHVKEQVGPRHFTTMEFGEAVVRMSGIDISGAALARIAIEESNEITKVEGQRRGRQKTAQISDFLREHFYPGAELDLLVHKDPMHQFRKTAAGPTMDAVVYERGINLARHLVEKKLAAPEEGELGYPYAKFSPVQRMFGRLWEVTKHEGEVPSQWIMPFMPWGKFIHARTALEEKESEVFGTPISLWSRPYAHFIRPTIYSTARAAGMEEAPPHMQERWQTIEYFDRLRWLKATALEKRARLQGDVEEQKRWGKQKRRTVFGVSPYASPPAIMAALPSAEREFFAPFSRAQTPEEREKILGLVPPSIGRIYEAQWKRKMAEQLRFREEAGIEVPPDMLPMMHLDRRAEGFIRTPETEKQYRAERIDTGLSYADWMRTKDLQEYFRHAPLPRPDWVGFSAAASVKDVELKMLDYLGECVMADQLLYSDFGEPVKAKDVKERSLLLSADARRLRVKKVFRRQINERIWSIGIHRNNMDSLKLTEDHVFPILRKATGLDRATGKYAVRLVRSPEVRPGAHGDKLLFPSMRIRDSVKVLEIGDERIEIDEDICYFIGWWLAEGHISYKKQRSVKFSRTAPLVKKAKSVGFSLSLEEKGIAEELTRIAKEKFSKQAKTRIDKEKNAISIMIYTPQLAEAMIELCGAGALNKRLSSVLFQIGKEKLLKILQAWQAGDGWMTPNETVFGTSSEALARQVWFVLNSCGYRAAIQRVEQGESNFESDNPAYRVRLGWKEDREAFQKAKYTDKPYFSCTITNLTQEKYTGDVFDFSISSPHYYLTVCGLIHNSYHEYGLWDDRMRALRRKPYIDENAVGQVLNDNQLSADEVKRRLDLILRGYGLTNINVNVADRPDPFGKHDIKLDIAYDSTEDYKKLGRGF